MNDDLRLSFDGRGINDATDPYKPRIATFTNQDCAKQFGNLFRASDFMLTTLKTIALHINSLDKSGIEQLCEDAIKEAEGK